MDLIRCLTQARRMMEARLLLLVMGLEMPWAVGMGKNPNCLHEDEIAFA